MLDTRLLKNHRNFSRVPWKDLAAASGLSSGHLQREAKTKLRVDVPNPEEVARVLGVPLSAIWYYPSREDRWEIVNWSQTSRLGEINKEIADSRRCLSITSALDSYLQAGSDMVDWMCRIWTKTPDWKESARVSASDEYVQQQIRARENGRFVHRILAPANLFHHPDLKTRGWLDVIADRVMEYQNESALGLVGDWKELVKAINKLLPPAIHSWDKICIVNHTKLIIRVRREDYYITDDWDLIRRIINCVDVSADAWNRGNFPKFTHERSARIAPTSRKTADMLLKLAR